MNPLVQLLDPFVPLALLVVAIVAFVRLRLEKLKVKIDGWAVVGLAAVVTFGVCLWMQGRAGGALDWMKLALDAPAVFILAVGGTSWLQKLQRDGTAPSDGLLASLEAVRSEIANQGTKHVRVESSLTLPDGQVLASSANAGGPPDDLAYEGDPPPVTK